MKRRPSRELRYSRTAAAAVVLLLLCRTGIAPADDAVGDSGKGHGVEVWPVAASELLIEPGRILSASFRITNLTDHDVELEESWELPEGWVTVVPLARIELSPGQTLVQLVAINVPRDAAAGAYDLVYGVTSLQDPAIRDSESLHVKVKRVAGLRFEVVTPPAMVVAGTPVSAEVALINEGNMPARVRVTTKTRVGYPADVSPRIVDLAPHGREVLSVRVETDGSVRRPDRQTVTLVAEETGVGPGASARVALAVETVPRADVRPELFETIPTTVTARGFVDNGTPGYQLEWRGNGTIGKHGEREVDFLLKGPEPDDVNTTLLGVRDEYRATYRGKWLEVRVGDQTYQLSRLTEQSQYGRGAGFHIHPGPVSVGAFYVSPRWGAAEPHEVGAWGGVKLGNWMDVKVNALSQGDSFASAAGSFDQAIASVDGTIYPLKDNRVEFEYAASGNLASGNLDANAHRLEAYGAWRDNLGYNFSLVHADPDFIGYFRDINLTLANVTYDLKGRFRLRGYVQTTTRNLEIDPSKGAALAEKRALLEARCVNQDGWCVGGGYELVATRDRAEDSTQDWVDNRAMVRALRSGSAWTVDAKAALGVRSNRLDQQTGFVQEYQFITRYEFHPSRSVAISGRLAHDTADNTPLLQASRTLGLQVNWAFSDTFSINTQFLRSAGTFGSSQADLRLRYDWPKVFSLALRGTYTAVDESSAAKYGVMLEISRKLGVPVARKKAAGAVRGRVYDLEAPGNPGIEGVVVRMAGGVAITDANGRFTLHAVSPGTHLLTVDSHTLGLDRILESGKEGVQVTVEPGKATRVSVGVERGATFTGSVRLFRDPSAPARSATVRSLDQLYVLGDGSPQDIDASGHPLASIVVRLTNDEGDVVERYTNEKGVFLFQGLKPGVWRAEVLNYNLPPQHYVENPVLSIGLEAGRTTEAQFRVLPRKRKIRMLESDGGDLTLQASR